jgi:hypothetical protein
MTQDVSGDTVTSHYCGGYNRKGDDVYLPYPELSIGGTVAYSAGFRAT